MARRTATQAMADREAVRERVQFSPRSYQRRALDAWEAGADRLALVWHRQAGKDQTAVEIAVRSMFGGVNRPPRPGLYLHVFPTFALGKKALWNAGSDGHKNLEVFPQEFMLGAPNQTEMQMRFAVPGGEAFWQIMGGDDPDAFRGMRPVGVTYSEYAELDPEVERVLDPALAATRGWKAFTYTPKGRNHGWDLYDFARKEAQRGNPAWYVDLQTIDTTRKDAPGEDGDVVTSHAYVEEQRARGVPEEFIQQEYWCSFDAAVVGSIYGDLVAQARREGRITQVPHNAMRPVGTCWDIGRVDATAIWFYQVDGQTIRFIDYVEDTRKSSADYAHLLREQKRYLYGRMVLPWDAGVGFAQSTSEYFESVGFRGVTVAERAPVQTGIDLTRRMFSRFVFDEVKCARGLECLEKYKRQYDPDLREYRREPVHDEFSHGADALRAGAMGGFEPLEFVQGAGREVTVDSTFDPRAPHYGRYGTAA